MGKNLGNTGEAQEGVFGISLGTSLNMSFVGLGAGGRRGKEAGGGRRWRRHGEGRRWWRRWGWDRGGEKAGRWAAEIGDGREGDGGRGSARASRAER